jgi:glycosyltransferase involved in cell wall biosynthesis
MFHELGYEVFSPGAYWMPDTGGDGMRPPMPQLKYNPDIIEMWQKHEEQQPEVDGKSYLTKEIVDKFDIVVVMHVPDWIEKNWEAMKHKRVIWRTIGQSVASVEHRMKPYKDQGMQIVRYSPMETNIPYFAGQDAFIRFGKDPREYCKWNGRHKRVVTFNQDMQRRDDACNYSFFTTVTEPFERILIGPGNENCPFGKGKVPFEELKQHMKDNRVYFYTGTHPASYTLNFIEAWMTGIPLMCVGPTRGNASYLGHELYEIPYLIENGITGFYSDNLTELRSWIEELFDDYDLARVVGENGRKEAIKHFDRGMIKSAWHAFLGG